MNPLSALLDFFTGGTARIQGLLIGAMACAALCLSFACWALWERASVFQARGERDRALRQVELVSAAAKACSAGVDHAAQVGAAAVAAVGELKAAAARLAVPPKRTVERTEKIIERTVESPAAGDCNASWTVLEIEHKKAGAP